METPQGQAKPGTVGWQVKRQLRILVVVTALLGVVVIGGGAVVVAVILSEVNRTSTTLCALKVDFDHRVKQGEDFLDAHPHGAFGFTPSSIRVQIASQRRTSDVLRRHLDCPPVTRVGPPIGPPAKPKPPGVKPPG